MTLLPTPTVAALGRVTTPARPRGCRSGPRRGTRGAIPREALLGRTRGCRATRLGAPSSSTRTLHFLQAPWPPHVESMAMPFQLAASNRITACGTRTRRAPGSNLRSTRPPGGDGRQVRCASAAGDHPGGSAGKARCAAIHDAPHASRSSMRSAALTARTISGERASMIALVRPCEMATGRNAAPIACRSGMPNDTFEAPSVMFTPNSSRSSAIVSSVRIPCPVSAPTGMASGSITMSSIGIPYCRVPRR